ncbi:MAG: sugar nucleotide-binding protein [Clostridia bacterium]
MGDGLLGTEIRKQTGWDYISRKKDDINFLQPNTYSNYLTKYDVVINCIGYTNTSDNNRKKHWDINYIGVIKLVNECVKYHKKLVHISTNYVYHGSNPNALETDVPVHLNNWYTYTKLLADGYVQSMGGDYLIFRTSFKPKPFPWKEGWSDTYTNADYVDVIADLMVKLISMNASGVYNVGSDAKTFFELAKQTRKNVIPILDEHSFGRPHNVTMNLEKLKNIICTGKK